MKYPKRCQYKHAKQKKYHVRNWAEYNEGLRRRGDLTVWFDEEAIANWKADKTGKPGGQRVYSDMAIETSLVVRMVYKLAYRQTEGFLHSMASRLGLGIEIPDYSTLCRRSRLLRKKLRIPKAASSQAIHLMIDSTGLRIHVGTARKPPKQRAWRKLHIAVDRETGNIVASELTASRARDATRVPALLTQIQAPLVSVAADSAYDKEAVYEAIEAHSPGRRTRVVIPPQRNATLSQNSNTAMQERDRHIRAIERHGRREWYKLSGYTKRSMVENAVYRYKAIIGPEMRARTLARQRVDEEAIANWKADKTGKPGGQRVYSDMAIETGLVVRMVYKLAYRQTEGFLHSIASLLGLGIEIPDYSTLCRRSRQLRKKLRIPKAASTQPIHLMIDSTGLRIHVGNARKPPKLRAWRKLHIAVDRETGNIVASELTASRARDATRVPALLTQIQAPLVSVAADSAYDKEAVYEAIEAHSPGRRTRVVIPPQRNATLSQNSNTAMQERDRHIRAIERHGRREWYKLSGYTKRSMVENAGYRYKAIIGPEMRARTLARQRVEHRIGCEILNKMAALGMPDTYCAG